MAKLYVCSVTVIFITRNKLTLRRIKMGSLEDSPPPSDFFHQTIITQNLYLSEKNKTMIFTNDIIIS